MTNMTLSSIESRKCESYTKSGKTLVLDYIVTLINTVYGLINRALIPGVAGKPTGNFGIEEVTSNRRSLCYFLLLNSLCFPS